MGVFVEDVAQEVRLLTGLLGVDFDAGTVNLSASVDLSALDAEIALKAPLASPTFTGTVDFSGATVTGLSISGMAASAANVATAQTSLDQVSGFPTFALRAKPGAAVAAAAQLGSFAFGGQYDSTSTHFNNSTAGVSAFANQLFSSSHAGSYLSLYTTPDDSVSSAEVVKLTGSGNVHFSNAGSLDANGWLSGGKLSYSTAVMVNPRLSGTGLVSRSAADGVITQDSAIVTSAGIGFTANDRGKSLYVINPNGAGGTGSLSTGTVLGAFAVHAGYIVSVDSATQVTLSNLSPVTGSSLTFRIEDTAVGTPSNTVWNHTYTDPGGGSFAPDVQSNWSFAANQGPRGVWGVEGTYTLANYASRASFNPITMQTFLVRKNARGVAATLGGGAVGFNLSDQVIADGAILTIDSLLGSGAYRGFVNNHVFSTLNGGHLDASAIEFREFQTQSGITSGVHLRTRVGMLINQFGGDILSSTSTSGTSTGVTAGPPGTLTDSGASWTTNQWAGKTVWAQTANKYGIVASNTSTTLTLTGAWTGGTPTTGYYVIGAVLDHNYGIFIRQQTQPNGFTTYPAVGIATQSPIELMPTGSWLSDAASDLTLPFTARMSGANAPGMIYMDTGNTYTFDFASASIGSIIAINSTFSLLQSASVFSMLSGYSIGATFTNDSAHTANLGPAYLFIAAGKYQADTKTITSPANQDIRSTPTYQTANSGTLTATAHSALESFMTVNSGATLTTRYGMHFNDATGAGTVTTQYGIYIEPLTGAGTNWGIYNNSNTKFASGTTVDFTGTTVTGLTVQSVLANSTKTNTTAQSYAVSDQTAYAVTTAGLTISNFDATIDSNPSWTASGVGSITSGPWYGMNARFTATGNITFTNRYGVRVHDATLNSAVQPPYTRSVGLVGTATTLATPNKMTVTSTNTFTAQDTGAVVTGPGITGHVEIGTINTSQEAVLVLSNGGGGTITNGQTGTFVLTWASSAPPAGTTPSPAYAGTTYTAAITNNYGLYIDALTSGTTLNYGVYSNAPVAFGAGAFIMDASGNITTASGTALWSGVHTFTANPITEGIAASGSMFFQRINVGTTQVASGDVLGAQIFAGWNNTNGAFLNGAQVRGVAEQTFTTTGFRGTRLEFMTALSSTNAGAVVRAVIDNAGVFAVGASVAAAAVKIDGSGNVTITDAGNIAVGTTTGTQIGTATTQKIGFYGTTPVVQAATTAAAPAGGTGTAAGGWDTAAHRDTAITTINAMRTVLRNLGLMA